jgi:hypothetical protein
MGILLVPIIIVCFLIYFLAIRQLYLIKKERGLESRLIYFGIGLSFALYIGHLIYWNNSSEIYAFVPYFFLPLDTVIFPMVVAMLIFEKTKLTILKQIKQVLLISIVTTMTFYIIFNKSLLDIGRLLHIPVTY